MADQAEIPFGLVEYTAVFKRPNISAWGVPGATLETILRALEPWGFRLEGVELKTPPEKVNDYTMVFKRTPPGLTFTLGMGKLVVLADNPDWSQAETLLQAMSAGLNAVIASGSVKSQFFPDSKLEIQSQQIGMGIHVQLKAKPRQEVTAQLVNQAVFNLMDGAVKFQGISLQREKTSILIDASVVYANALFVRFYREHPPEATLQDIATVLRRDEEQVLHVLGIEGAL